MAPGLLAANFWRSAEPSQTHSVGMNLRPRNLSKFLVCHRSTAKPANPGHRDRVMFDLKLQAISAYFDPPRHQDRALLPIRVMALFSAFPRTLGGTYVFWNAAFGWEPIFRRSAALLPVSSVDATAR
jgi:hypothetical protein